MNPVIKITIGVVIFLFILATILFGPIGFFMMIFLTGCGIAGYIYEGKNIDNDQNKKGNH